MRGPKVYLARRIPIEAERYIAQYCDYEKWDSEEDIPRETLLEKIKDKDGVMLTGFKVDEEFLSHAPKLKVVSNIAVGYNNYDIEAMKRREVIGTNTPYVLDDTVADLIMGLMISASRRFVELDSYLRNNKWVSSDEEKLFGMDVHHATLGIIGMGRIGEAVAKRARFGFDMEVLYYNRNRKLESEETIGVKFCDFDTLLEKSDFIVIMTPYTKDTYHIIDREQFNRMKKTAVFINASRGQTVNEEALIEALENRKIFAAGLDVYEREPISAENPLIKLPNTVLLPHIGSATEKTRFDMCMLAAKNLVSAVLGEEVPNVVPELNPKL